MRGHDVRGYGLVPMAAQERLDGKILMSPWWGHHRFLGLGRPWSAILTRPAVTLPPTIDPRSWRPDLPAQRVSLGKTRCRIGA